MTAKKHNLTNTALLVLAILCVQVSSAAKTTSDLSKNTIIPKPVSITATGGYFALKSHSAIYVMGESPELKQIGLKLAEKLKLSTGFKIEVISTSKTPGTGNIFLTLTEKSSGPNLGEEGYELVITKKLVLLSANTPAGVFRGVQTIRHYHCSVRKRPLYNDSPRN